MPNRIWSPLTSSTVTTMSSLMTMLWFLRRVSTSMVLPSLERWLVAESSGGVGLAQRLARGVTGVGKHSLQSLVGLQVDDDRTEQVGGGVLDALAEVDDDEQQAVLGLLQGDLRR